MEERLVSGGLYEECWACEGTGVSPDGWTICSVCNAVGYLPHDCTNE
jgi:hypothetical protein